jgi:hypothetical protein
LKNDPDLAVCEEARRIVTGGMADH